MSPISDNGLELLKCSVEREKFLDWWKSFTAGRVSVFGVILVLIFPRSDSIRTETEYGETLRISAYLVRMWENTVQNNSENKHFLRIVYQRFIPIWLSWNKITKNEKVNKESQEDEAVIKKLEDEDVIKLA